MRLVRRALLQPVRMASTSSTIQLSNVLANSRSPYLLQHKDNPVAWQEFTPETINLARQLNRPIFLSSGYSACHWCHVLAHESFENEDTAKIMNDHFVNIKIDREERPDVDRMYMTYLQATNGGGGWPMSIFMTPNLEPFFAGTYFPPQRFRSLLVRLAELWEDDQEQCETLGKNVIESLKDMTSSSSRVPTSLTSILSTRPSEKVYQHLSKTYDPRYGGFSKTGPKFPSCSLTLEPLARLAAYDDEDVKEHAREMGVRMLRGIWEGGIHDWVGGGVARYSVDEKWIVPHFEKMLYDQAQLVSSALDFALLSEPGSSERQLCFDLAADILEYSLRDLKSPEGAFWSAEDADSAPEQGAKKSEGAFYIWSASEIAEIIGDDKNPFNYAFGVKNDGNVDLVHDMHGEMRGRNILYRAHSASDTAAKFNLSTAEVESLISRSLAKLKTWRDENRERPGLDDKILTSWNGLMLTALAKAHTTLPESYSIHSKVLPAALSIVESLRTNMHDPASRTLYRSFRHGRGPKGQTDDYAFLIRGLLDIYQATGDDSFLAWAVELQREQDELFWDEQGGGWWASREDEGVLVRMKDSQDGAEPSSTSVSASNLSRLSLLHSNEYEHYESLAERTYTSIASELEQIPRAFGLSVAGLMDLEQGYGEYIITGRKSDPITVQLLELVQSIYSPNKVIIHLDPDRSHQHLQLATLNMTVKALVEDDQQGIQRPGLRVCEGGVCGMPFWTIEEARRAVLDESSQRV